MSAAPTLPRSESTGVPMRSEKTRTAATSAFRSNITAASDAKTVIGTPVVSQCANAFARTITGSGSGERTICSSVPSAKSCAKRRGSERRAARSAATQTIPGAMLRRSSVSAPTPSGTSVITTRKKNTVCRTSDFCRYARSRSRRIITRKSLSMGHLRIRAGLPAGGRKV